MMKEYANSHCQNSRKQLNFVFSIELHIVGNSVLKDLLTSAYVGHTKSVVSWRGNTVWSVKDVDTLIVELIHDGDEVFGVVSKDYLAAQIDCVCLLTTSQTLQ